MECSAAANVLSQTIEIFLALRIESADESDIVLLFRFNYWIFKNLRIGAKGQPVSTIEVGQSIGIFTPAPRETCEGFPYHTRHAPNARNAAPVRHPKKTRPEARAIASADTDRAPEWLAELSSPFLLWPLLPHGKVVFTT